MRFDIEGCSHSIGSSSLYLSRSNVIGVGGFLGIGDHYVVVRPSAVKLSYDARDKKWHASMDVNADQLKAAPEFKYPRNA